MIELKEIMELLELPFYSEKYGGFTQPFKKAYEKYEISFLPENLTKEAMEEMLDSLLNT